MTVAYFGKNALGTAWGVDFVRYGGQTSPINGGTTSQFSGINGSAARILVPD